MKASTRGLLSVTATTALLCLAVSAVAETPFTITLEHAETAGRSVGPRAGHITPIIRYEHERLLEQFGRSGVLRADVRYQLNHPPFTEVARRSAELPAAQGVVVLDDVRVAVDADVRPFMLRAELTLSMGTDSVQVLVMPVGLDTGIDGPRVLTWTEAAMKRRRTTAPKEYSTEGLEPGDVPGEAKGLPTDHIPCGREETCIR